MTGHGKQGIPLAARPSHLYSTLFETASFAGSSEWIASKICYRLRYLLS